MRISQEKNCSDSWTPRTRRRPNAEAICHYRPPQGRKQFYIPQDPSLEQRLGVVRLPLVKQHTYLGIRVSYQNYEALTLSHRLQHSWSAFHRLLPALRSKSLSLRQRLQIWQACPYASLAYGLDCLCLGMPELTKLRKHAVRQLRTLCKSPVFIARESTTQFLERLGKSDPALQILNRCISRVKLRQAGPVSELWPTATHRWWNHLRLHAEALLAQAPQLWTQTPDGSAQPAGQSIHLTPLPYPVKPVSCPDCGQYFSTLTHVRRHRSQKHRNLHSLKAAERIKLYASCFGWATPVQALLVAIQQLALVPAALCSRSVPSPACIPSA